MSDSSLNILCRYQYDPLDRLTGVGLLAGNSTQRFYQVNHLTTELGQQTQRTILRHGAQLLAQQQSEAGVTEKTLLVTDQAHSLLQSLSPVNSRKFSYTAYGHHPNVSGLSRLFGFNGEYPDDITGHYPLGHGNRFYNPVLMRFNSPDELSPFDDGGINSYAYCENDPINFFDPTGNGKLHVLTTLFNRSRASVIIRPERGSVITKHSSIIKAQSQTSSAVSSPISTNSNPILNSLTDQSPTSLQQPGLGRTPAHRVPILELPATTRGPRLSAQPSRSTRHIAKLKDIGEKYDALKKKNPDFIATGTPKQSKELSEIKKNLDQSTTASARANFKNALQRKSNIIKRDNMRELINSTKQVRS
ncbi:MULTISPECIES: RHS repeat-associated core domain-containing protein [unclassified Pseudomonas]|uniref:RHS repeat-associated core domain-containing protein n=1 Tax=unclassified Pseudomonas TaxID=196821 RepID=UPI0010329217|nr:MULTISPECIES: RHS repeat-associated core domain-containing protein [unclassified Pseudomonas]